MIIFVYGASGNTGAPTVEALQAYSQVKQIRIGTRDVEKTKEKLKNIKTPMSFYSDLSHVGLAEAMRGVDALLIIPPTTEERMTIADVCTKAAKQANVKYIAAISTIHADCVDTVFGKQFNAIEKSIKMSGIPYGIVRCPMFHELLLWNIQAVKEKSAITSPIEGDAKYASISVQDIGTFCANLLVCNEKPLHRNKTFLLIPPKNYSQSEICQCLSKALGKEVKSITCKRDETKQAMLSGGLAEWQTNGILELYDMCNENRFNLLTTHFQDFVGHPAITMEEYIQKVAPMFK